MMTSASTSSLSKVEFSPSLSEVVTRVWPASSSHLRMPSSFSVVPRSSGTCHEGVSGQRHRGSFQANIRDLAKPRKLGREDVCAYV